MLRPVQAARSLSTRNLTGITLYSPNELVISARAGTPLAEIEATLAEHGQHIIAEPPDLAAIYRLARAADTGRRGRHQPLRPAARRLGRDARSRAGHPRGHRTRRGDPLRRTRAEERHRARPVQAADRQPRHAWRHHRSDAESAAGAGSRRHGRRCRAWMRRRGWRRCPPRSARRTASRRPPGCRRRQPPASRAGRLRPLRRPGAHRGFRAIGGLSHRQAA